MYRKKSSYISKDETKRRRQLMNLNPFRRSEVTVNIDPSDFANNQIFRFKHRILDNLKAYGECWTDFQETFFFKPMQKYKYIYLEGGRGADKTGSISWSCLQDLIIGRHNQRVYFYSCDLEQSREDLADIENYLKRNPAIRWGITVQKDLILNKNKNSFIKIESSDDVSSFGKKPSRVICEEFCFWKNKTLWDSIITSTGKIPDCQLIISSNAGWDYSSFQWQVREFARTESLKPDSDWYFFTAPSSEEIPYISKKWIEMQRGILHPSVFQRLILNKWTQSSGDFILKDDLDKCISADLRQQFTGQKHEHFVGVDLGLVRDSTAIAIVHNEGDTVFLDSINVWQGSRTSNVIIADIEDYLLECCLKFRIFDLSMDTWQLKGTAQKLTAKNLPCNEFLFTTTNLNRLTQNLYTLIKSGKLKIYNDPELIKELLQVKLVQTSYGIRINHEAGRHDDRVIALGIACLKAVENQQCGEEKPYERVIGMVDQLFESEIMQENLGGGDSDSEYNFYQQKINRILSKER